MSSLEFVFKNTLCMVYYYQYYCYYYYYYILMQAIKSF